MMEESLRIYDKDIQEKFPNRIGKHAPVKVVNKAINDYVDGGDHHLGVEIIRLLHFKQAIAEERNKYLSEQCGRYARYEAEEKELDFEAIRKVTKDQVRVDLLNRLYFIFEERKSISYDELSDLIKVMEL